MAADGPFVMVFAWKKGHGSPFGHAAIGLGVAALTLEEGYFSFHPKDDEASLFAKTTGTPAELFSFPQDLIMYEKNKMFQALIGGLNVGKMKKWWEANEGDWKVFNARHKCSSLVHEMLLKGGSDNHCSGWGSWNTVWSPNDVKIYATEIVRRTHKHGSQLLSTYP